MNLFQLNGFEVVLATAFVCVAVCYCWWLTCETATKITDAICDAVKHAWDDAEQIVKRP